METSSGEDFERLRLEFLQMTWQPEIIPKTQKSIIIKVADVFFVLVVVLGS